MGYVWVDEGEAAREAMRIARVAVEDVAVPLRNRLVQTTPRDSGRTANAWAIDYEESAGRAVARVYNNVRAGTSGRYVWQLLHEGTGRYGPRGRDIVPVRRKALRWRARRGAASRSSGGFVFATRSKGYPPNPFIRDAVQAASRQSGWTVTRLTPPGLPVVGS